MTSSGHQRVFSSLEVGTRFFKIILHATLRDKKLLIPGRFARNHGDSLFDSATLKVPTGSKWPVDVVRDETGVWFGNGWQEFAEFYSLQFGHFLVFEYLGCSAFSVVICDKTAAEIAYPIRTTCEANIEEAEDPFDTRIRKKYKPITEVSNALVQKKKKTMRGSISAGNAARMGSWPPIMSPGTQVSKVQCASTSSRVDIEQEGESVRMTSEGSSRKCKAMMTGFNSPHPFFEVQITPSMTKKQMHVPRSFAMSHIGQDEKVVQLQVRDKGSWFVALIRKECNQYVLFGGGWDKFMKDNSVKPGDVCVFECLRRWTNVVMEVIIVRDV